MSKQVIHVQAPSRLHFGILSIGDARARQYGGVGVMVAAPGVELSISPCSRLNIAGPHATRVAEFVRRWTRYHRREVQPRCLVRVLSAPRQHVGLGTGTQLALSVAAGLNRFFELSAAPPGELSSSVERGRRSAVGTYGFVHGGMIVELGKTAGQRLAPLEHRVSLPSDWRFVLLISTGQAGLSGRAEAEAFRSMSPMPQRARRELARELNERLIPSARQGHFESFSESIYRYGITSGRCFSEYQGGAFASPQLAEWVQIARTMGIKGVGQSSWGPTLFALLASSADAEAFVEQLKLRIPGEGVELITTRVNDTGAIITQRPYQA